MRGYFRREELMRKSSRTTCNALRACSSSNMIAIKNARIWQWSGKTVCSLDGLYSLNLQTYKRE